jgi:glycyl-tRNA synthetase (class II)
MLTEELRAVGIVSTLSRVGAYPYRLALEDEMGTPYRIIVDEKTLETGILALQDRDTAAMEDMAGRDVLHSLQRMLSAARLSIHSPTFSR